MTGLTRTIAFVAVLLPSVSSWAGTLRVEVQPSTVRLTTDDVLSLEVRVVSQREGQIQLEVPSYAEFTELSRSQSEGTSIQFLNGKQSYTRELKLHLELQPEKIGTLTIPAFIAQVGNERASSRPFRVRVESAGPAPEPGEVKAGQIAPPLPSERDLFVRYRVDRLEAFVGEQIIIDLEIVTSGNANFSIEDGGSPPQLDGFWTETLDKPQRLTARTEVIAGKRYTVYRMWRLALFALEAGPRTIPARQMTFAIARGLFGNSKRLRRKQFPVLLEILPLPAEGQPRDFRKPNVGSYSLQASVDRSAIAAGKAVLLRLKVAGRGNLKAVKLPEVTGLEDFREFKPTLRENISNKVSGVSGTKEAEILLMPKKGGRLEIPPFELPTFDPATKSYKRLRTRGLPIMVQGDPTAPEAKVTSPAVAAEPSSTKIRGDQLRPIRYRSRLAPIETAPWRAPIFWVAWTGPGALFLLVIMLGRLRTRAGRETEQSRRRLASKAARTHLDAAKANAKSGDASTAYASFVEAVFVLGTEKTGVALRGLTTPDLVATLCDRGLGPDVGQALRRELEAADYARFGPVEATALGAAQSEWIRILGQIEAWKPEVIS